MSYIKPGTDPDNLSTLVVDKPLFNVPVEEAIGGWAITDPYTGYVEVLDASRIYLQSVRDAMGDVFGAPTTYTVVPSLIDEGLSQDFTITRSNSSDGKTIFWNINHITTSVSDFVSVGGVVTFGAHHTGIISIEGVADATTEGDETFTIALHSDSPIGDVVAVSDLITLNDISQDPIVTPPAEDPISYDIVTLSGFIEGGSYVVPVNTTGVTDGTTLYWTIAHGTTEDSDFALVNGSFVINGNNGSFTVSTADDLSTEGNETFSIDVRTGSITGTVVVSSQTIILNDTSITPPFEIVYTKFFPLSNTATDPISQQYRDEPTNPQYTFTPNVGITFDFAPTSFMYLFFLNQTFNDPDVALWDVSGVTNMIAMFGNNWAFNQDISGWDTSNVTSMSSMFWEARSFNQPIGTWNTSNVTDMTSMFLKAINFNQDISGWDTSNVILMNAMFDSAEWFNQPIGTWNTSKVERMARMFFGSTRFNQPIGAWNTTNVWTMSQMFEKAHFFNQPIAAWDFSNVTSAARMFFTAEAFNQNLSTSVTGLTASPTDFSTGAISWTNQNWRPLLANGTTRINT